ncbi:ABC transporter substrate-binding protein [Bradyrhizobium sp. Gha]|uniref:ABC transporter substrate-binding protein n=1 Tax=Bradyrhizobium sp. Gha TaxID=1855318 RepID=UPI0008ECCC4E|nr:ABC transporter substrate-binding protein [Bradyrhizobium sp. Gha]SFK25731.1 putative ABC transport system substrate-binding protein [Bradyrhizobium sp. Gha]
MRRRDFLAGLLTTGGAGAVWAAEPNRVYRLAVCEGAEVTHPIENWVWSTMFTRLGQLGYTEGKNLVVERYNCNGRAENYAAIAGKMVQTHPDVIVVSFNHQLIAQVAKATSTIPIVTAIGSVDSGIVRNINRPEGNITGIVFDAGIEMQGKHLDLLRQAVPAASRVAYLSNRYDWEGAWGRAVQEAGRKSGISITGVTVEDSAGEAEYRQAFETMAQQSTDALVINGLFPNYLYRELILELALKHRLPSISWWADLVQNGQAPIAYTANFPDFPEKLADLTGQTLSGARVADIPLAQPTKFILAINLKTAKALGVEIPPTLTAQADAVIE